MVDGFKNLNIYGHTEITKKNCGYPQEQLYNVRFDLLHIYYFKSNGSFKQFLKSYE